MKNAPSFLTLICLSCSAPQTEASHSEAIIPHETVTKVTTPEITVDIPNYQFSFANLRLNQTLDATDLTVFKHYGEFYTEDFNL